MKRGIKSVPSKPAAQAPEASPSIGALRSVRGGATAIEYGLFVATEDSKGG